MRNPEVVKIVNKHLRVISKGEETRKRNRLLFLILLPINCCEFLISAEKRQQLQKKAVTVQIELNTNTLNRIESLRDSHRKAAMQDLEEWRVSAEKPFLQDMPGKMQENRKAYR